MSSMLVTLDTSQLDMSPMNLFALGTNLNNWLISVIAETSQDPIGPCGPLEQSADSFRHSLMVTWSLAFAVDFASHPAQNNDQGRVRVRVSVDDALE